jgi:hypothetical protein
MRAVSVTVQQTRIRAGGDRRDEPMTDCDRIRELFCDPPSHFRRTDVRRLTHATQDEIAALLDADGGVADLSSGEIIVPWELVIELAERRWTPRMIDVALRAGGRSGCVPFLNRLHRIEVSLPLYQIRLLHLLAERVRGPFRARLNASDILERQLLDLGSALNPKVIDEKIPGFSNAVQYPTIGTSDLPRRSPSCAYCGASRKLVAGGVCAVCRARHEDARDESILRELKRMD